MSDFVSEKPIASPENLNTSLKNFLETKETIREKVDYLLICGQGPVQTKKEKVKAESIENANPEDAEANSWMKFIAYAAGEIYQKGLAGKLVLTGGKTGGEQFPSEAVLMKNILIKQYSVPENDIVIEDKAKNTLQNFAFSINAIDDQNPDQTLNPSFGILGTDYHTERIHLLSTLFELPIKEMYSAEETLLRTWGGDLSEGSQKFLLSRVIPEEAERLQLFQLGMKGEESKSVKQRINEEKRYSACLVEVPAYWIGYIGLLQNEKRIKNILANIDKSSLETLGINPNSSVEEIKKTLLPFTTMINQGGKREMPFEEVAQTGNVPEKIMEKIKIHIPPKPPVIQSRYHK